MPELNRNFADIHYLADVEETKTPIKPRNYRYYAKKVRKQKFDLDSHEVNTEKRKPEIIEHLE